MVVEVDYKEGVTVAMRVGESEEVVKMVGQSSMRVEGVMWVIQPWVNRGGGMV